MKTQTYFFMKEELSKLLQEEFTSIQDEKVNRILIKLIDIYEKQDNINSAQKDVSSSNSIQRNSNNDYKLGFDKSGKPTWILSGQLQ